MNMQFVTLFSGVVLQAMAVGSTAKDDGLLDDPYYFAVHWEGYVNITEPGNYVYKMGSDDDS